LQKSQYGFQPNISTIYALLDVLTNSFDNINDQMFTGLIFLDLTKAFDFVNHDILLAKLDHDGIRGPTNSLLRSFLKRKQFVSITVQLLMKYFLIATGWLRLYTRSIFIPDIHK